MRIKVYVSQRGDTCRLTRVLSKPVMPKAKWDYHRYLLPGRLRGARAKGLMSRGAARKERVHESV